MGASSFSQSVVVLTWQVEEKGQPWSLNNPSTTLVILGYNRPPISPQRSDGENHCSCFRCHSVQIFLQVTILLSIRYAIRVQNQVLMSMFYVVPPPLLGYLSDFVRRQVLSGRY